MARILAADDDEGVRGVLEAALTGTHHVTTFADGETLLAHLEKERLPDAVLLDVMMPGLDGLTVLRQIRARARTRNLPVVMVTARVGEQDHLEGWQSGADGYITKPFDVDHLQECVEEVLHMSPTQREAVRAEGEHRAQLLRSVELRFDS